MSPASFSAGGGPTATARTLKPCASSSFAAAEAVGDGWVRPATTAKAPFTIRSLPPLRIAPRSPRTSSWPDRRARTSAVSADRRAACPRRRREWRHRRDPARRPSWPARPSPGRGPRRSRAADGRWSPSVRCASACPSYPRTGHRWMPPRPRRRGASAERLGVPETVRRPPPPG